MRIKLLYPLNTTFDYEANIIGLPYGLGVLAACLKKNNVSVGILLRWYPIDSLLKILAYEKSLSKIATWKAFVSACVEPVTK